MAWDSYSFHVPADQCRITKRYKKEIYYTTIKGISLSADSSECPAAHGSCLCKRIKRVTWLSKRISDWQLSRALASVVLDTAVKPEIKFLQHIVFSSQLGFKGELFLILFEQGSWLLRAWPGQSWPLPPLTQAKQKTRKHPNINRTAHRQPCAKYRGREPQWCLPSRVWRFLSICFSKSKKIKKYKNLIDTVKRFQADDFISF